jgi:hypothetical protein
LKTNIVILPTAYLGSLEYFSAVLKHEKILIEHFEYFEKQTIRNSCNIYSPNGLLKLSVPLHNRKNKSITKDIEIDYKTNWQLQHIRSIESAYRSAPFFEFYWDYFLPIYNHKYELLIELNQECTAICLKLFKEKKSPEPTTSFLKDYGNSGDYRFFKSFKKTSECKLSFPYYTQVFSNKLGFIKNLSVIDLLFNQGPESKSYLLHN